MEKNSDDVGVSSKVKKSECIIKIRLRRQYQNQIAPPKKLEWGKRKKNSHNFTE